MPIENRDLGAGTRLVARYKKRDRSCEVVETVNGLRYRLDDGQEFKSLSTAGKAVMGGVACNGWVFWSLDGSLKRKRERSLGKTRRAMRAMQAKSPASLKVDPKTKLSRTKPTTESYGCGVCGEYFTTMKDATEHAMSHTD